MPQRPLEVRDTVVAATPQRIALPLRLHAAVPADIPALVTLVNAAYQQSEAHVFPGSRRTDRDRLLQELQGVVVAELEQRIVACAHIDSSCDPAHFGMLAVDPELHARGIGSMIIDHAERMAQDAGRLRMCIETVREAGLIPYYERRGYRVTRETPGQLWNNGADWGAIIDWQMVDMEKRLR